MKQQKCQNLSDTHTPTKNDVIRRQAEGLTPQQERAALLLASGKSGQETAQELNIHRSTLWEWRRLETFTAYHNSLVVEMQEQARDALLSLHEDAIKTVKRVMESGGDTAALKAALFVLGMVEKQEPGTTDPRELVRKNYTTERETILNAFDNMYRSHFDEQGYAQRCEVLGIEV